MGDKLIQILDETTDLATDVDLFYLEIPLGKIGLWVMDSQTDSRFNAVDNSAFDIYYRGKTKQSAIKNIKYLKTVIDALSGSTGTCELDDGTTFKLEMLFNWDYIERDSEGYYVFSNRLKLFL